MATGDSTRPGLGAGSGEERLAVHELLDDDTGRWQITTQTSITSSTSTSAPDPAPHS